MASNWEKPGFEVLMIGAECTAYSGAQAPANRPTTASGISGGPDRSLSPLENPLGFSACSRTTTTR